MRICSLILALGLAAPALGQQTEYEIGFAIPGTHEAQVRATFSGLPAGPVVVQMSRSSPGRYAVHDFAKNVYAVSATDGAGRPLQLERPDPHSWRVVEHDGTVNFRYTLFGDRIDGTFLGIDATHAHMNMPATFAWTEALAGAPVRLRVRGRPGWRVATQLAPTSDPMVFTAPNLQYFLDSPTEASAFVLREWEQPFAGQRPRYRLAVHHTGPAAQVDSLATLVRRVIDEQHAIWGEPPSYDYGAYTFIVDYLPWADGDGMEHRNSTIVTSDETIADSAARVARLSTISHELFHAWNVERLRPRTLEPFDFTRANMSDALWFAEGFTSYYGPLAIRRAGIYTDAEFARRLSSLIVTTIESPARAYGSPVQMSQRAPFVDAATSVDPTNHANTFLSYYTWGAAIAAGLDLTLRTRFDRTLDEWLRVLWSERGRAQTAELAPATPYALADLRTSLGAFAGDTAFANDFFARYVEGSQTMPYAQLLAHAGFLLEADSVRPSLRATLRDDSLGVLVVRSTASGSLFNAGIGNGDVIVALDGEPVRSADALEAIVAGRRVGDIARLDVIQRGGRATVAVPLLGRAPLRLVTYEAAGRELTEEQRAFREAWLGSGVGR
ncbi:MAG TPA: PDZ domain-containing protein [Longimicrobiales bacterium]